MPADFRLEELPELDAHAARVQERLARPARLAIEQPLSRHRSAVAWFLARADAAAARVADLEQPAPGEVTRPLLLEAAMMKVQKPFKLWNVPRDEWESPIAFERGTGLALGRAASEHGPARDSLPGHVTPAGAVAQAADAERLAFAASAWGHRSELFRMLAQDASRAGLGRHEVPEPGTSVLGQDDMPMSWAAPPDFGQ